ncbi:MAG: type VI secretion system contractile sheath large subunit [Rubrivivax sp.]|nr:MAG: type VI secretion system contractile sheath large subunit [Rubrivivax sp.]
MTRPPPSQLGDCLRALSRLQAADEPAARAVAKLLGLARSAPTEAPSATATAHALDEDDRDDPSTSQANSNVPRAVHADQQLPPARDAELTQDTADHEPAPAWLAQVEPLDAPVRVSDPFNAQRETLFDARLQRAIVARLAATWQDSGELDLAAVVSNVAAGRPLRRVPRRAVATTLKGVRLLVDEGESMQPFQQDVAQLVRSFRRTVGPSRLRVEGFLGVPSRDVRVGLDWQAWRPGSLGMGLVLVTDLALPPYAPGALPVDAGEWQRFLGSAQRAGATPMVVVPRGAATLPAGLKRHARLLPWGRRSGLRTLAAAVLAGGPAANLPDEPDDAGIGQATPLNPLAALDEATLRLASACALAVRVEPPLLRAMRLALDCAVDVEVALWFSPVVRDRATTGLVFDGESRELLLRRLRGDEALLERAWRLVCEAHANLAPALRAEEAACYHWARGDDDAARAVLRSMVATVVDPSRSGAWRWATQAVARLPRALQRVEEAQMFAMGAALRSGEGQLLRHVESRGGGAWHWLRPPARELELAVTLREGMIEFAPATVRATLKIQVPDTPLVLIEILPASGSGTGTGQPARLNPRQRSLVPVEGDSFELRVVGGERYRLQARRQAAVSSQKFVARNRAPRVQIEYELEMYGATKHVELPFVMGVLADLSGTPAEPLPSVAERKFVQIDVDNFDARMQFIGPRVAFQVENLLEGSLPLAVDLTFNRLDDFSPAAVARRIEPLAKMLQAREQLRDLLSYSDGKEGAELLLTEMLKDRAWLGTVVSSSEPSLADAPYRGSDVAALLERAFKPRTEDAKVLIEQAVLTLARLAWQDEAWTGGDLYSDIARLVASHDRRLSEQLNRVLHHDDFKALEGAWRGLHYLVTHSDTGPDLKIRIFNVSKKDLAKSLRRYRGTSWDESPLFKKVYEEEYGQFGGEPYGCLIGDYHFDHRPADVEMLGELSKIASAAHAPFIAGASPAVIEMDSWKELSERRDMANAFATPEYAGWRALRESEDARYLALTLPRFLARQPYGAGSNPVEGFDFEEDTGGSAGDGFVWANSAYAMAANINRAFKEYGWCASIRGFEGGGAVEGLPVHVIPSGDGAGTPSPMEVSISDRREAELARAGFLALMHRRNTDVAAFISAQSLQKVPAYDNAEASANAPLAARLPYLFACSRFVHYIKCITRDKIGSFISREQLERFLNQWLQQYVDKDPAQSSESVRSQRPLAEAQVSLEDAGESMGYYAAAIYMRPHYQLEGLTVSLRMVTRLPSLKGAVA